MHGLINRALQRFVEDTFGQDLWGEVIALAEPGLSGFESMLSYEDALTERVLSKLATQVGTPREMLLEDLGIYLVSHPNTESLRRLMRFGGEGFTEFLYSLDDLPDRARLAVPDLVLPGLDLIEHAPGQFTLDAAGGLSGIGHVLLGLLRAMADDYGVLALVEVLQDGADGSTLMVSVAEAAFAEGRGFDLAPAKGAG
jgi:hypothetical protein